MNAKSEKTSPAVDQAELDAAETEAAKPESGSAYIHVFGKPFTFEGETFEKLTFDWDTLTAADGLAIENELASTGRAVISPEFSGEYLIRMAARACKERRADGKRRLGIDAYRAMPMRDFAAIRGKARSFLLRAGS